MPWKIVNLDYDAVRPHLHMRDPREGMGIHLRAYLDDSGEVEVCVGAEKPDDCPVRATVGADLLIVNATRFQRFHLDVLVSVLAGLDVAPEERDDALAWMSASMKKGAQAGAGAGEGPFALGWYQGNVTSHPVASTWPDDLTDEELVEVGRDSVGVSKSRYKAITNEMRRRGMMPPRLPRRLGRPARKEVAR